MSIERIDKFDFIRMAYANTTQDIIANKAKLQENELAVAITDKKLCVKIGDRIYSTPLTLEGASLLTVKDEPEGGDVNVDN